MKIMISPRITILVLTTLLAVLLMLMVLYGPRMVRACLRFVNRVLHPLWNRLTHRLRVCLKMLRFYLVNWLTRMAFRLTRILTRFL